MSAPSRRPGALLSRMRGRLGALPLGARLILYFVILISIPLLAVSVTNHRMFSGFIEELVVRQKSGIGALSLEQIELLRGRDERSSDEILFSRAVQERLLARPYATELERARGKLAFEPVLAGIQEANQSVGILLAGANGEVYRSNDSLGTGADLPHLSEIVGNPRLVASRGANVWIPLGHNVLQVMPAAGDVDAPYLYLARRLANLAHVQQALGYSIIQFRYDRLRDILERAAAGPGEWCVLADAEGTVLWDSRRPREVGGKLEAGLSASDAAGSAATTVARGPHQELLLSVRGGADGWQLVMSVPAGNLLGPSRRVQRVTAAAIAAVLAAAIAIAILLSRGVTVPIQRLSTVMRRFGSGELALRSPRTRGDEIGRLEESFNQMAGEIQGLLATVEQEHASRRKLELDMLEYQINPHFLYNILDSINWMAQKAGQRELGEMVTALARFFRIGLSGGRDVIPVADELEHARNYLLLSRMRYRGCFQFSVEADEGVERLRTLKILLQPLLENAMNHGLDKSAKDGEVRVRCRADGSSLCFEVSDNGRGIEPAMLERLRTRLARGSAEPDYEGGIGLLNVSQRIRLHYGNGYGLAVESAPGRGTTVTVRIPREE